VSFRTGGDTVTGTATVGARLSPVVATEGDRTGVQGLTGAQGLTGVRGLTDVHELTAVHALTWLTAAGAVGAVLSLLLLTPELGRRFAPFTYGRLMPLHLNFALYGACALPLVALLLRLYLGGEEGGRGVGARLAPWAIHAWSAALTVGAASWLAGQTSGKIFLDWAGPARLLFLAALAFLAFVLALGWVAGRGRETPRGRLGKGLFWLALVAVVPAMAVATRPELYPPINPASGGPTGGSLLGSTLGLVWIFWATPLLLGLERVEAGRIFDRTFLWLVAHGLFFAALDHGDHSHHEAVQILALGSLLPWAWWLPRHLRRFAWPGESRRWLLAFLGWGGVLLATAPLSFLPGVLERLKFTNALVAHAHLAMAGVVLSFNLLILACLNRGSATGRALEDGPAFALWQVGGAVQILALVGVGALEVADPGALFRPRGVVTALYALRLLAGLAMVAGAGRWLALALRRNPAPRYLP